MINILLIEDHVLIRQGIRLMLDQIKGIRIVGEASTGEEGIILKDEKRPDLVILDFQLADMTGLEVAERLFSLDPQIKILIVTAIENELLAKRLLYAGVQGFITKSSSVTELERAIRMVCSGQRYLNPEIANRLALSKLSGEGSPFDHISKREMDVLMLLAQGTKTKEIATELNISIKTVNSYRYRMYEKLGVKSDVELVKLAVQHKLIEVDL